MPRFHDPIIFDEGAAPGTPSTAQLVLYVKADGRIYFKDDTGIERQLTPISVGTTAPTSPNMGDLWVDTN